MAAVVLSAALLLAAADGVAGRAAGAQANPKPCSTATVAGVDVWTYCGKATATVAFSGKKVTFKGGSCGVAKGLGVEGWGLGVGRYTVTPATPKFRWFGVAWTGKPPKAGTYKKGEFVITFQLPGKTHTVIGSPLGTPLLVVKATAGARKATFSGRVGGNGPKITGSWSC